MDDGSTRGDPQLTVVSLADRRVRLIQHPRNMGLAAARNTAIRAATGELIVPLDADDRLAPSYIAEMSRALGTLPEADLAFPDLYAFGIVENYIRYRVQDARALLQQQWLPGSGTLFKKDFWLRIGGYCEDNALRVGNEDWDFYLAGAELGFQARHVPEPLYFYRQHSGSMVTQLRYSDYLTREFMYSRHKSLFDHYGLGNPFRAEGYRRSVTALLKRDEKWRAIALAMRALFLMPRERETQLLAAKTILPSRLTDFRLRVW